MDIKLTDRMPLDNLGTNFGNSEGNDQSISVTSKGSGKNIKESSERGADDASAARCLDGDISDIEPDLEGDDLAGLVFDQTTAIAVLPSVTCQPGLDCLLEADQVVAHMNNLRYEHDISQTAVHYMEVIDITKRLIVSVEQDEPPFDESSFLFRVFNKDKQEVIQFYNPGSKTCLCCGINLHWIKKCNFQTVVYAPLGHIIGFIRRRHTWFVQEFEILDAQENIILRIRGPPTDLEIYSTDLENELGRLGRHWMGIMFELARSRQDYGMTFPLDLDVRVKALLLGALFSIYWLYNIR